MDDEYARDPKILLTTSRDPSAPLKQFVNELNTVFPNSQQINRGAQVTEIVETCRKQSFTDLILVYEKCGVPDRIVISHLPFGPTAYFQILYVIGERTANILKHLFPVAKPDSKSIITLENQSDNISFRHHLHGERGDPESINLKEVGPRFELQLYQIKLAMVDQEEAETEWVLRTFMNTSKKQNVLGE